MGSLRRLGAPGDVRTSWDPDNEDEVAIARRTFDDLKGKGYRALTHDRGHEPREIEEFDPDAERLVMYGPMAGG
jgi:hypothetical protein